MPDFTSSYDLVVLEQLLIEKNYRRKFIESLLSRLRETGITDFPAVSKTGRTVYFGTKDRQQAAISTGTHSKLGGPEPKKAEKTRKKVAVKKPAKKAKALGITQNVYFGPVTTLKNPETQPTNCIT